MTKSRLSLMRSLLLPIALSVLWLAAATTAATDDANTATMPALGATDTTATSDMPTLSSTAVLDTAVTAYPAPSVPPTQNAPYMQTSHLPDGTVFICVGAILGAFGLAILLWRAIIACLLHRSVEKAAMSQHLANDKAAFPAPPGPFYKYTDSDSSQNVPLGRGVRRTARGPIPSATPSQTNLFFSPTAGTGNRDSAYRDSPNRDSSCRDSRFLPSGFYAAGSAPPQHTDVHGQSIISTTRGQPCAVSGHTPPESPGFGQQRAPPHHNNMSTSSINLTQAPSGRTPSAFLDDLLDEHPDMFPPQAAAPSGHAPSASHPYRQSGRF